MGSVGKVRIASSDFKHFRSGNGNVFVTLYLRDVYVNLDKNTV